VGSFSGAEAFVFVHGATLSAMKGETTNKSAGTSHFSVFQTIKRDNQQGNSEKLFLQRLII
jgi:hypothetical protein